jgi:hypothetical protein
MGAQSLAKEARQQRRQQESRRKRVVAGGLALAGLALVGSALWLTSGRASAVAEFDYGPEDVVYDEPFQAVHDMGEAPPVAFLPKGGPQPEIAINERFYDFGTIGPTDVVTREFVVANLGEAPLTISRAYTTCGCTTADFSSRVIPPGKVVLIGLRFDAGFHDTAGQSVRRGIIIESNDPERPSAEIWVAASVRSS